ncbi:FHA domain-containing protein [Leptolyngbya sp. FACHB-17]|uniref:FHA domain-containing protein n=1 Tax=unclassified Leptolyngbya TaxID=2650499 RepID=UPI001681208F|nr:FHA domain-containing protein [Leptolyngbya sp. FACHB-17]MBD2083311.1 FHA domain-containing protein [Leptolyngbya sp. FACHB-17]
MKQEFYSPEDRYAAFPASVNPPDALAEFWDGLDEENFEDPQSNRNETLTIERDAQATIEPPPGLPDAKPRYIQGVVIGTQAHLVTNLLKQESITLRQSQRVWTIGRNRSAALPLQDRKLSRRHAVILYREGRFYLIDLNSMNGSYVNGVRVQQRQPLHDGDCICVGSTRFFFFVSVQERVVQALHPEVLERLNNAEVRNGAFIDFSELQEEISFNLNKTD